MRKLSQVIFTRAMICKALHNGMKLDFAKLLAPRPTIIRGIAKLVAHESLNCSYGQTYFNKGYKN